MSARLLVVVEHLLGRLGLVIGGGRGRGLNCQRSWGTSTSLHTELTHPVDHAAVVASSITCTASTSPSSSSPPSSSPSDPKLKKSLLCFSANLSCSVRAGMKCWFLMKYFLFHNQNIFLTCQFLVSIFPPLIPQTASSEGLVIKRVQSILGLQRRDLC